VRPLVGLALTLAILFAPASSRGLAQETRLRRQHPWGHFAAGAWKFVRVVTENFDQKGAVTGTSTTETKTSLSSVGPGGLRLLIEAVIDVAGKRLEAEPQCIQQDFFGLPAGANPAVKELEASHVMIEGRKIPCRVEQIEEATATATTVTKLYVSDTVAPYILRRESVSTDLEGKTQISQTTVNVVALGLPWKISDDMKTAALVRTVQTHAKGTTETWAATSAEVPGGVLWHASKELDENGRLVRRSALELVDFGLEPDDDRAGPSYRPRNGRPRKPHRYAD
jgi:hypothetical protein